MHLKTARMRSDKEFTFELMLALIKIVVPMILLCLPSYALSFSATSGLIRVPSASIEAGWGYQIYNDDKWLTFTKTYLSNKFEVGARRHTGSGHTTTGYKLNLIPPSSAFPGFAFGAYDVGAADRDPSYFAATTLPIEFTGTVLHAGFISEGPWKSVTDISQSLDLRTFMDAASRTKSWYAGIEQSIVPMLGVMVENLDGVTNAGIRFRPVNQLTFDIVAFDLGKKRALPDKKAYNLNLSFTF